MKTCNLMASETRTRPWAGVSDAAVRVGSDPGAQITPITLTA
jgi:16S rRNA C1402 (ribose-2'-O) methylase RsmI